MICVPGELWQRQAEWINVHRQSVPAYKHASSDSHEKKGGLVVFETNSEVFGGLLDRTVTPNSRGVLHFVL